MWNSFFKKAQKFPKAAGRSFQTGGKCAFVGLFSAGLSENKLQNLFVDTFSDRFGLFVTFYSLVKHYKCALWLENVNET